MIIAEKSIYITIFFYPTHRKWTVLQYYYAPVIIIHRISGIMDVELRPNIIIINWIESSQTWQMGENKIVCLAKLFLPEILCVVLPYTVISGVIEYGLGEVCGLNPWAGVKLPEHADGGAPADLPNIKSVQNPKIINKTSDAIFPIVVLFTPAIFLRSSRGGFYWK